MEWRNLILNRNNLAKRYIYFASFSEVLCLLNLYINLNAWLFNFVILRDRHSMHLFATLMTVCKIQQDNNLSARPALKQLFGIHKSWNCNIKFNVLYLHGLEGCYNPIINLLGCIVNEVELRFSMHSRCLQIRLQKSEIHIHLNTKNAVTLYLESNEL